MKITVIGSGYVGLVTGACLAEMGNDVLCIDVDAEKVARLMAGEIPIHEPGLEAVVARNVAARRLHFSTDAEEGVRFGTIQFIAVGTPPDEDGAADMQYVLAAARNIADGGSLTVIATAPAPFGGESTVVALDGQLTALGRFPALDLPGSGTLRADALVGEKGAEAIAKARVEAAAE